MLPLARFAWFVLAYNLAVIGWGAYVRATGSGAGCGNHWPLCNGDVLPRSASAATLIEYSHRLTSGIALLLVLGLFGWVFRSQRRGHPARTGASLSLVFIVTEAAVGAGLVLFELVADNASMARAMFMVAHLVNTFLLLAALTLTASWCGGAPPVTLRRRPGEVLGVAAGAAMLLLTGASGAVAALGDTLFPAATLAEALAADLSASSHVLIRLRVLHPVLAVSGAFIVIALAARLPAPEGVSIAGLRRMLISLVAVQLALGVANVLLLAPVWLQLLHLLAADGIWIAFVLLGARAFAVTSDTAVARAA